MSAQNLSQPSLGKPPKRVFFAAAVMIFFSTLSVADSIGFVPNYMDEPAPAVAAPVREIALASLPELGEETDRTSLGGMVAPDVVLPESIHIPAIDLDLAVQNPSTRDIAALDALLQNGPARHVDSARLGEAGTVIIFAHSSHLPIVRNKMYQAFNRIPELTAGDTITLRGGSQYYLYTVTSLRQVDVNEASIDLSPGLGTRLTLVTCDTLTGKSARYILEADFVGAYSVQ